MNVPTITVGGEPSKNEELENLKAENKELRAWCEQLKQQLNEARMANEMSYMRGRCDGLEFSITHEDKRPRCHPEGGPA